MRLFTFRFALCSCHFSEKENEGCSKAGETSTGKDVFRIDVQQNGERRLGEEEREICDNEFFGTFEYGYTLEDLLCMKFTERFINTRSTSRYQALKANHPRA